MGKIYMGDIFLGTIEKIKIPRKQKKGLKKVGAIGYITHIKPPSYSDYINVEIREKREVTENSVIITYDAIHLRK